MAESSRIFRTSPGVPESDAAALDGSDHAKVPALARAGTSGVAGMELTSLPGPYG
jgi:hypothetical protein